jgi:hypothetical protein
VSNIVSYNVGDWVFVDGYGNGFITKIEFVEFYYDENYPKGEGDPDGEIEFTVHCCVEGVWDDYYADLEDITLLPAIEVDKEVLLDLALQARDYDWCKELCK